MATLLENYKGRVAVADKFYAQKNNGQKLDFNKKLMVAQCLDNTARFMNEAFSNSVGTQRSDLGLFKKLKVSFGK